MVFGTLMRDETKFKQIKVKDLQNKKTMSSLKVQNWVTLYLKVRSMRHYKHVHKTL